MYIAIASGKGGTGKTLIATNLVEVIERASFADADVEEPNGHLFLRPEIYKREDVYIKIPEVDYDRCTGCGVCAEHCQFNAIAVVKGKVILFRELCHSCGVCSFVCPEDAIQEVKHIAGEIRIGEFNDGRRFVDGKLSVGQLRSSLVIEKVVELVENEEMVILDAPPGASCSVISATHKADVCLLVTEPTPFGLHDLKIACEMLAKLRVPYAVLLNRADIGDDSVERYCQDRGIPILERIPFEREIAEIYAEGELITRKKLEWRELFEGLAHKVIDISNYILPEQIEVEEEIFKPQVEKKEVVSSGQTVSLAVLSGKGGTGKTMLASCIAGVWKDKVSCDADVDAANLGILLRGEVKKRIPFSAGMKAEVIPEFCTGCARCAESCRFNSIIMTDNGIAEIEELKCEGCGLCHLVCPTEPNAIIMRRFVTGEITICETPWGHMVTAMLKPGAEASGKLVTEVRENAENLALENNLNSILIDGSPGIGCPVNATLTGTKGVVLVVEPSRSSKHDLERIIELLDFFNLPRCVVINRYDLSHKLTEEIEEMCEERGITVVGKIPFDRTITESIVSGHIPSQDSNCSQRDLLNELSKRVISDFKEVIL
ncbi:MAG: cobyrinic acid ac-diamide synthase [Candidatus Coatesbacteria bacterium]|nr:MAG: cobyrinic acid ac-diamide synthase [Candidatus Coatesbacteria bacterium]